MEEPPLQGTTLLECDFLVLGCTDALLLLLYTSVIYVNVHNEATKNTGIVLYKKHKEHLGSEILTQKKVISIPEAENNVGKNESNSQLCSHRR